MIGAGYGGVEAGSAVQEVRIQHLEARISDLALSHQRLLEKIEEHDGRNDVKVHEVICTISDVHGMRYPGCPNGSR